MVQFQVVAHPQEPPGVRPVAGTARGVGSSDVDADLNDQLGTTR